MPKKIFHIEENITKTKPNPNQNYYYSTKMVKYTEEQLLEWREEAYIPQSQVLDAFNKLVETVAEEFQKLADKNNFKKTGRSGDTFIDEHGNERTYNYLNRRRGSRSNKPLKKKATEVAVDDDGWATLTTKGKKSFGEEGVDDREAFRESVKAEMKVKPNNKKLGSSKAVDSRDVVADKQTNKFNAFAALDGSDEDEDEEDDE